MLFLICNSSFALGNWTHRASVSRLPRFQWGPHPWGLATAHHWFRSEVRLSFPPAPPPPPPDFALSEPLPGGLQGWLRAQSDMRTCSPASRRGARRRSSYPSEERKRGPGTMAIGQADQDRDWCNDTMEKQ